MSVLFGIAYLLLGMSLFIIIHSIKSLRDQVSENESPKYSNKRIRKKEIKKKDEQNQNYEPLNNTDNQNPRQTLASRIKKKLFSTRSKKSEGQKENEVTLNKFQNNYHPQYRFADMDEEPQNSSKDEEETDLFFDDEDVSEYGNPYEESSEKHEIIPKIPHKNSQQNEKFGSEFESRYADLFVEEDSDDEIITFEKEENEGSSNNDFAYNEETYEDETASNESIIDRFEFNEEALFESENELDYDNEYDEEAEGLSPISDSSPLGEFEDGEIERRFARISKEIEGLDKD